MTIDWCSPWFLPIQKQEQIASGEVQVSPLSVLALQGATTPRSDMGSPYKLAENTWVSLFFLFHSTYRGEL